MLSSQVVLHANILPKTVGSKDSVSAWKLCRNTGGCGLGPGAVYLCQHFSSSSNLQTPEPVRLFSYPHNTPGCHKPAREKNREAGVGGGGWGLHHFFISLSFITTSAIQFFSFASNSLFPSHNTDFWFLAIHKFSENYTLYRNWKFYMTSDKVIKSQGSQAQWPACSPSYSIGWERRISRTQKFEASLSNTDST
jgi:hypothetical protein